MATMTRKRAAEVLRELLGDGDTSEYGQALVVAVRALEPAERKVKAKLSPHVAAFLKMRLPNRSAPDYAYKRHMAEVDPDGEDAREARAAAAFENPVLVAQFRFGMRPTAGMPYDARIGTGKDADTATLAAVLHADRWAA